MSVLLIFLRNIIPEILSVIAFLILQFGFPILGFVFTLFENVVLSLLVEIFLSLYRNRKKDRERLKYLQKINNKIEDLSKLTDK